MLRDSQLNDIGRSRIKQEFLEHLEATGHVTVSARAAGVHYTTIYRWRESDAAFRSAWLEAKAKYGRRCPHCRQPWPNRKFEGGGSSASVLKPGRAAHAAPA